MLGYSVLMLGNVTVALARIVSISIMCQQVFFQELGK